MSKKQRDDLFGYVLMFAAVLVFIWWVASTMDRNVQKIRSYTSHYINEVCGSELTSEDVGFQSEGSAVWYMKAPISVQCYEEKGKTYIWHIPRPGRETEGGETTNENN